MKTIFAEEVTGETFKNIEQEVGGNYSGKELADIITNIIPYFFYISGVLLLFYLVIGGYNVLISQGDPKKMQQGQQIITNALIGFLLVFIAYWVVQLIASLLGLEGITTIFS